MCDTVTYAREGSNPENAGLWKFKISTKQNVVNISKGLSHKKSSIL
jgi:hypothetical protein